MTSAFIQWYNVLVLGEVAQSIQISFHVSSCPITTADVLKRNLIILNYVTVLRPLLHIIIFPLPTDIRVHRARKRNAAIPKPIADKAIAATENRSASRNLASAIDAVCSRADTVL